MKNVKIVIERHEDGYVGYPLGFTRGAIVGEGETYGEALKDTERAIHAFIQHYGKEKFFSHIEEANPTIEAYIAETSVAV